MISTPALLDTCSRCGHLILTAHSEGIPARVDVTPLDRQTELAAILAGRTTYDIQPLGLPRKPFLHYRNQFRILNPHQPWKVVAAHRCPPGTRPTFRPGKPQELVIPFTASIPKQPPF